MILDTQTARIYLPQDKIRSLQSGIVLLRSGSLQSVRFCMQVLGRMVSSFEAIPYAQFHTHLQRSILAHWDGSVRSLERRILQLAVWEQLRWWLVSPTALKGQSFLSLTWSMVTADASVSGWGAAFRSLMVQRQWSAEESRLQINLELRDIFPALSH